MRERPRTKLRKKNTEYVGANNYSPLQVRQIINCFWYEQDIYDIDTTQGQTDTRKDAETPTAVKAETDFVDKFTNAMSKVIMSGSTTDDRTITKDEESTADLIAKIDELQKLQSLTLEEFSNKFNDLFIQIL